MEYQTKDSGKREVFTTGAQRDIRRGKGRFDLLPMRALTRDAQLYERGAAKYEDRNWEKGMPFSRFVDSAMRHLVQYMMGMRDEDHLAAVRFNIGAIMELEETHPELDDLPKALDKRVVELAS